jgi:anti-sigma factor RsiW
MFDWIRERLKDADSKREERVMAYVDGRLSADQRRQFEVQLAQDESLRAEVTALQAVKQRLSTLQPVRAPRNYTLDPSVYGAPDPAYADRLYPAVRFATAMAALLFLFMVTLTLLPQGGVAEQTAMFEAPIALEVTAVVERVEEEIAAADAVEPASEAAVSVEAVQEVVVAAESAADAAVMAEEPQTFDMAAESVVAGDTALGDGESDATDGSSSRIILPTISAVEEAAPVAPEIVIPTNEVMRSADSVTATVNTMPDMATEQMKQLEVGETVASAESSTADWTQRLLIASIVLFVCLLATMIWLRRRAKQF